MRQVKIGKYYEISNESGYSVCAIYNNKYNNEYRGVGFFCQIPDPQNENETMIVLFTCYHVLPKDNNDDICKEINYQLCNRKKESICLENRRIWVNNTQDLDYACIEIFPKKTWLLCISNFLKNNKEEDKIFKIDKKTLYSENLQTFEGKGIKIYTILKKDDNLSLEELNGHLLLEEENEFNEIVELEYSLVTEKGNSGSPIFNIQRLMGIHTAKDTERKRPIGNTLKNIYNDMKNARPINNKTIGEPQKTNLYQPRIFPNLNKKYIIAIVIVFIIILSFILYKSFSTNKQSGPEDDPIFIVFLDKDDDETYTEYKNYTILSSGNYRICAYGAEANPGGKGGKVCVSNDRLKKDEVIKYKLW